MLLFTAQPNSTAMYPNFECTMLKINSRCDTITYGKECNNMVKIEFIYMIEV